MKFSKFMLYCMSALGPTDLLASHLLDDVTEKIPTAQLVSKPSFQSAVINSEELSPTTNTISKVKPRSPMTEQFWGISRDHIDQLFATSTDLVCIIDYGGKFIRLNPQWQITLGYSESELKDQPYTSFIHPKDLTKTLAYEQNFTPAGLVNRYRRKSGSYRWLDWIGIPNASQTETSEHRFAIARDITLQKIYEKNIGKKIKAQALQKYQTKTALLEAVAEVQTAQLADYIDSVAADNNKRILKIALQNFIQLTCSEFGFIGEVFYDTQQQPAFNQIWSANQSTDQGNQEFCNQRNQSQNNIFDNFIQQVVHNRQPLLINDFQAFQQQQSVAPHYQNIRAFLGIPLLSQGELMGVVGLSHQQPLVGVVAVANRREPYTLELLEWLKPLTILIGRVTSEAKSGRYRQALANEQHKRQQLEDTNRMKSLFIAHMSHEIRTPLMGIMGHLDLIDKRLVTKEACEQIDNAQISAKSLLHIANDVLDISKIEAGMFKLDDKVFDFNQVIQETLDILKLEAETKKLKVNLHSNTAIPTILQGDPMRLRQILFNLVNNAIKFTHQGSIDIDFSSQVDTEQPNRLILNGRIKDTGIGIHPDTISRLFQPFAQEDQSIYRQFGGTGLGLYITKQLCTTMQGNVSVSSQPGIGSSFDFQVRLTIPAPDTKVMALTPDTWQLPPLNILVVEDNLMNQKILKGLLTRLKCTVTLANNGQEAVDTIKQTATSKKPYDVVLMDGEMPIMNGLEATRQIRTDSRFDRLPIIAVTAHAMLDHQAVFLAAGMNGYLTKPVIKNDLIAEIKKHLNPALYLKTMTNKRKLLEMSTEN